MAPSSSRSASTRIARVCHHLAALGYAPSSDGNVSERLDTRTIAITRSGAALRTMRPADIVKVRVARRSSTGRVAPSSEMPLHVALYGRTEDIRAIVHVHPPYATAFAAAGTRLTPNVFPEAILDLGDVPLIRYVMPSTKELGESVARYAKTCGGALLANHGAVTWGRSLDQAVQRMEKLEHISMMELFAQTLGGVKQLSHEQVAELRSLHPLSSWRDA